MSPSQIEQITRMYNSAALSNAIQSPWIQKQLDKIYGDSAIVVHVHFSPVWDNNDDGYITKFKGLKLWK